MRLKMPFKYILRRRIDRLVMHCVFLPMLWLVAVRSSNLWARDLQLQAPVDLSAIATLTERGISLEKRLDELIKNQDERFGRLEKVQDGIFIAFFGVFVALLLNVKSQQQRREDPERRKRGRHESDSD